MKKLVTILLVLALVLGMSSVALAAGFSDTKDLAKGTQASITKLSALKVVNGYPDGTFKPANNITRAEFAKIAISLAGMETSAEVLKNTASQFSDVATGQWYTGWVNLAASQGYVKGFPDGTFKPNSTITYAEVLTVLMRVLGYNDNLAGPWPVDYIAKAGALGLTDGVSFSANLPCTRADMAVMADSTLDATIVEWDAEKAQFVDQVDSNDNDITLLDDKFSAALNEAYLIDDIKYDDGTWSVHVQATSANDDDETDQLDGYYDLASDAIISDGSLAVDLGPTTADIIYNDDDEVIEYIDVTSKSVKADGADCEYNSSKDQYEVNDVKYDIAEGDNAAGDPDFQGSLITSFNHNGYYKFVLNQDNEVIQVSRRTELTPAIVDKYNAATGKLTFKDAGNYYSANYGTFSAKFKEDSVVIENEKDWTYGSLDKLMENDIVYIDQDWPDGYDYYIDQYPMSASGKFTSFKGATSSAPAQVKIEGVWYDVAVRNALSRDNSDNFDDNIYNYSTIDGTHNFDDGTYDNTGDTNDLEDLYGTTVKYFLNKANQVCYMSSDVEGSTGNEIYGVVTDIVDKANISEKLTKIKVMKKDGTEASYTISTDDVELYYPGPTGSNSNDLDIDDFIKFQVNSDNQIDDLTVLATFDSVAYEAEHTPIILDPTTLVGVSADFVSDYTDEDNSEYIHNDTAHDNSITDGDTDNNRIKVDGNWVYLTDATIIFDATDDDALSATSPTDADDECNIASVDDTVDWADSLGAGGAEAYVQTDGNKVEYIYVHNAVSASTADYTAVLDTYVVDGDDWVDVDIKGVTQSYEVSSSNDVEIQEDALYDYSISSNKFEANTLEFAPDDAATFDGTTGEAGSYSVGDIVYAEVTDTDSATKGIEINNVWYYADADTMVYDYSDYYDNGDDPVYAEDVSNINEGDYIIFIDNGDDDNIAALFIVVNNIDTAGL